MITTENNITENLNRQLRDLHKSSIDAVNIATDIENEEAEYEANYPYVVFQVYNNKFAVNCKYVLSIEQMAQTTEISVSSARGLRGIAYYTGEAINAFDMRETLGFISQIDYLKNIVNIPERILQHQSYVNNLSECVTLGRQFELTTDPHQCAFGKWFDSYMSRDKSEIALDIRIHMDRIAPVHDKFHKLADDIKALLKVNRTDEAANILNEIEKSKDEIVSELKDLETALLANITELMIVLTAKKNKKVGIIVDNAESVEFISEIQDLPPAVVSTEYVKKIGIRKKSQEIVLILEALNFA